MYVTASAITIWRFSISLNTGWDFSSMNTISFLDDRIYLSPNTWARDLVITNIHALVLTIIRIAFSLILAYSLIRVYLIVVSYSFTLLNSLRLLKTKLSLAN